MEFDRDPFPPSLPHFDGTRILGENANVTDAMEENGFDFDAMNFDSPDANLYWEDATSYQSTAKPNGNTSSADKPTTLDASISSQSPESSLPDSSSSDSSRNQHKRNHSSDSSQYGALGGDGDIHMAGDTPMANGIVIGAGLVEDQVHDKPSPATDVDLSNRAMECHFDFDSAASSPSPYYGSKNMLNDSKSTKPIKMPYRIPQRGGYSRGLGTSAGVSKRSPEASLSSIMRNSSSWPEAAEYTPQQPTDYSDQYINGAMLSGPTQTTDWQRSPPSGLATGIGPSQPSMFQQPLTTLPFAMPTPASVPPHHPQLHIAPLPLKSRVETQIPIKMTLYPPPSGISRLHLQTHTISKSKLVAKPPPEKAPDMLELHAMLVCTSAMQDPVKRARAFAKASEFPYKIKHENRRSSSGDTTTPEDDENKPLNGGPVQICQGCVERERKRAARKKTKNVEEEQLWQKDESKRIIVFNTQEVREWQHPSPSKMGDMPRANSPLDDHIFPENALQVEIPMRIACYCRHQEEKAGFQVIFTIRDHQDQIIAQQMTNSIVITDDHKTHAPPGTLPPQSAILPDGIQFPGPGIFSQAPPLPPGPGPFRHGHAFSTTDLQSMGHQSFNMQQMSPFAVPQHPSQATSATLTPKSRSRQASPSAPSGQQSKKRKASGSGRIRNELTMTKLQTTTAMPGPDPGALSTAQSFALSSGPMPSYTADYNSPHGLPAPSQFSTGPPTPSTADSSFFSSAQRSQSMENLQGFTGIFSAPSSVRPSRAPSPNALPYGAVNPVQSISAANQTQRSPLIHKLTPAEGSTLGGLEVTCLGSGFFQGLEVKFGDALATTTTFWGENALVCLVPPATQAGIVPVTFKHNSAQRLSSPPNKQVYFKYLDETEQELIKQALSLINRKFTGNANDPTESARHIIDRLSRDQSLMGGSNHGSNLQRSMKNNSAMLGAVDLETAMLSCLNIVDLDDSPYVANINAQGPGGQSMLHLSASLGYYRLAAGLLARGANPDLRDNNGMSPMHIASLRGHSQIIRKLRSSGGDPTLRSLNGYTSADMATSQYVRDASNAIEHHHRRSKSAGATPVAYLSRASSMRSVKSSRDTQSRLASTANGSTLVGFEDSEEEGFVGRYKSQPVTPAQVWARSRRNSNIAEQRYPDNQSPDDIAPDGSLYATNPAWRDQLLAQIQQLQQSLQRTLPTLQIPALPPIPNLEGYQAYPVVRRISALVPQRNARSNTSEDSSPSDTKEADYRWWELFAGPPSYDDIYPESKHQTLRDDKTPALVAAGETFMDQKCEINFDQAENSSVTETVNLGNASLTRQQEERLKRAHAKKVKRLKNDRNLFFLWLPLLFFVLVMMLKDRLPRAFHWAIDTIHNAHERAVAEV